MNDSEKVIRGLECSIGIRGRKNCDDCPYDYDFNCIGCDVVLLRDAIALLKERESTIVDLRNVLQLIADIAYDYDGYDTIEGLKSLIDEIREMALQGVPNE